MNITGSRSVFRNLITAFGGQVGIFLFGFGSQIILARTLGPDGKGVFSLVILFFSVLSIFSHLSFGAANAHFTGRKPEWRPAILGNSFVIAVLMGGIVILLAQLLIGTARFQTLLHLDQDWVRPVILFLPAAILLEYLSNVVLGLNRIKAYASILAGRELLFLLSLTGALVLGTFTVRISINLWLIALTAALAASVIASLAGVGYRLKLDSSLISPMLKFGIQQHIAISTSFLLKRVDLLIVGYFLTAADVGCYSIVGTLISILWFLPVAASQVIFAFVSNSSDKAGSELTPKLCRAVIALTVLTAVVLAATAYPLIRFFYGAAFLPALPATLILLPGGVMLGISGTLAGDLSGRGKPHYAMIITVIAAALNIGLNFLLIPLWHLEGAALTSLLTYGFSGALYIWAFSRESGVSIAETLFLQKGDLALARKAIVEYLSRK